MDQKLRIDVTKLYYAASYASAEKWGNILARFSVMRVSLKGNPKITLLNLNSTGGDVEAAISLVDVIYYKLDTHIHGDCLSASILILGWR